MECIKDLAIKLNGFSSSDSDELTASLAIPSVFTMACGFCGFMMILLMLCCVLSGTVSGYSVRDRVRDLMSKFPLIDG